MCVGVEGEGEGVGGLKGDFGHAHWRDLIDGNGPYTRLDIVRYCCVSVTFCCFRT